MKNLGYQNPLKLFKTMKFQFKLIVFATLLLITTVGYSQITTTGSEGDGVKVEAEDGSFSWKFSTRMQNLYEFEQNMETKEHSSNFLVRRARIKMEGHAGSKKLTYKIELGQSTRDIGLPNEVSANSASIILDAVVKYNFAGNWSVWFGQTKLPGNIERVISSSSLQFVDRSNLNSRFNIDRDQGMQLHYDADKFRFAGAISIGEGRNDTNDNLGGYDYTGRIELLPMGKFASKGDYKAADLAREETPKLMIGMTYDLNSGAARQGGQLGGYMTDVNGVIQETDLKSLFIDAHFKYNGFSTMIEYANRSAENDGVYTYDPILLTERSYYTGHAINAQMGYVFPSNIEAAVRYTKVTPEAATGRNINNQYTFGLSKYVVGHTVKVQSDITLIKEETKDNMMLFRFQVELGI